MNSYATNITTNGYSCDRDCLRLLSLDVTIDSPDVCSIRFLSSACPPLPESRDKPSQVDPVVWDALSKWLYYIVCGYLMRIVIGINGDRHIDLNGQPRPRPRLHM